MCELKIRVVLRGKRHVGRLNIVAVGVIGKIARVRHEFSHHACGARCRRTRGTHRNMENMKSVSHRGRGIDMHVESPEKVSDRDRVRTMLQLEQLIDHLRFEFLDARRPKQGLERCSVARNVSNSHDRENAVSVGDGMSLIDVL